MPAKLNIRKDFLEYYEDPRNESGFDDSCYPDERSSGDRAPAGTDDSKRQFCAVYARRNACVRALSSLDHSAPDRAQLIDQTIKLTDAIDHLEDACTPIGFLAEPVMNDDMFTTELVFTHAPMPGPKTKRSESSVSLYVPVPLGDLKGKEGNDVT